MSLLAREKTLFDVTSEDCMRCSRCGLVIDLFVVTETQLCNHCHRDHLPDVILQEDYEYPARYRYLPRRDPRQRFIHVYIILRTSFPAVLPMGSLYSALQMLLNIQQQDYLQKRCVQGTSYFLKRPFTGSPPRRCG